MLLQKHEVELTRQLGEKIGYGNMMAIASALWQINLEARCNIRKSGAHIPVSIHAVEEKYKDQVNKSIDSYREHIKKHNL